MKQFGQIQHNKGDKKRVRIGVFSDTHGNFGALQAITSLFDLLGCDEVIHCGDMIAMGGQSMECLDFFFSSNIVLVKGNHDLTYSCDITEAALASHVTKRHKEFVYNSLQGKYKEEIKNLPAFVQRNYFGIKFVFTHYALNLPSAALYGLNVDKKRVESMKLPENYVHRIWTPIYQQPTAEIFDDIYSPFDADYIVFGHKHEPCNICGKKKYIDIGSVGCHRLNCASGIVFDIFCDGEVIVRRVYTPYDRQKVFDIMVRNNIPDFEDIFDYYFKESENRNDD